MRVSEEQVLSARFEIEKIKDVQEKLARLVTIMNTLSRVEIRSLGEKIISRDEPVVILATHQNSHDFHALNYFYLRHTGLPLSLIQKSEIEDMVFEIPLLAKIPGIGRLGQIALGPLSRDLGGIPVGRTPQTFKRQQLEPAIARLRAGGSIGIFGEGGRTYGGNIGPIQKGAVFIAKQAGVEIITAGIYGPSPASPYKPRSLTIYFGSKTNPREIADPSEFYRTQLQSDYHTALAAHHGRSTV